MNIKEFFSRWKEGIRTLSPAKQLNSKIIGHYGAIIGMGIGFGIMALKGAWYFLLLGVALVWLQITELIGTTQQYRRAKEMERMMEGKNE